MVVEVKFMSNKRYDMERQKKTKVQRDIYTNIC